MKVGLISSGFDCLPLFSFLHRYDHDYHIYRDRAYRPRGDKQRELRSTRIGQGVDYLLGEGVEALIVPPVYETYVLSESDPRERSPIIPLFARYLRDQVLPYSLVGKLGLLCDHADLAGAEQVMRAITDRYHLTDDQQATKRFHRDFPVWKKEVRMWKYFLTTYGKKDPMVRKTIKQDLRYFRDAAVDTIIPLSRGILWYDQIVRSATSRKKVRFHGRDAAERAFGFCVDQRNMTRSHYQVTIHATARPDLLLDQKKRRWLLQRGDQAPLKIVDLPGAW